MTVHLLMIASFLLGGVTHIPRRRDPPGFWEHVERNRGSHDPLEVAQESGVEWWLVVFAVVGLIYIGFWSRSLVRSMREKRDRREKRTIHPIEEPESPEQRFKRYK